MKKTLIPLVLLLAFAEISISQEKMEIEGAIIIKNSEDASPAPGTIRFNTGTSDFEGHDGNGWKSLTKSASPTGSGMVTDIDGNQYLTVTIGTQTWMRENLRTTRYRNGAQYQKFY